MSAQTIPHSSPSCKGFAPPSSFGDFVVHERVSPVPYCIVDREHLDIRTKKHLAVRVLVYLTTRPEVMRQSDGSVRKWTVSEAAIASHFGMSPRSIDDAIKTLTEWGYVRTRRRAIRQREFVWDWHIFKTPEMNPWWVKDKGNLVRAAREVAAQVEQAAEEIQEEQSEQLGQAGQVPPIDESYAPPVSPVWSAPAPRPKHFGVREWTLESGLDARPEAFNVRDVFDFQSLVEHGE